VLTPHRRWANLSPYKKRLCIVMVRSRYFACQTAMMVDNTSNVGTFSSFLEPHEFVIPLYCGGGAK
jgi:hypothetical protein